MNIENQTNNRVSNQIKEQQRNNVLYNQSNTSKGMAPYKKYKTDINNANSNKRMKNELKTKSGKNGSTLGAIDRGINVAKNYKNSTNPKEKEVAKSQMKGSAANAATTALTGSQTLGNLAEKASKIKDRLNPLKAIKNAVLGKINGDDETQTDELGNPKQQENRLENVSFTIPPKVIKWIVIAGIPAFSIIIFIVLFVTASQTYVNILGIDSADKVTEDQLESKDDNWHEEGKGSTELNDVEAFNYSDNVLIADNFIDDENANQNIFFIARTHEADLSEINDYFSDKLKCSGKDCESEPEYLFYLKMNDIYMLYKKKYNVKLDLVLLMSSLSISDEQASEVYIKNSKGYSVEKHEQAIDYIDSNFNGDLLDIDLEYNYKTINNYIYLSSKDFSYDMQILAQNMVTKDGEKYKKNLDHYDEFLEEYIELKYYTSDTKKQELFGNEREITNNNIISTAFKKYDLTEDQLLQIASLCYVEQGTSIGAAAEASLMANRFELSKGTTGTTATDLYNYIRNSSWWNNASGYMDQKNASKKVVEKVKAVLVDGKRTLPGYVDEHDCIDCGSYGYDITKIVTGNTTITTATPKKLKSHSSYIKHKTVIYNKYGSVYTFYSFPTSFSDPFGYTSADNRRKIGDFYYDNSGNPVGNTPGQINPNVKGDYTKWKQCSEEWGNKLIKTKTVCDVGCLVTSIAIQVARSGTQLTVLDFSPMTVVSNASFGCPTANSLCNENFSKYAPNFYLSYTKNTSGWSKTQVIKELSKEIQNGNYPIIFVDGHHYVAVTGTTENDIIMQNPGSAEGNYVYQVYKSVGQIKVYKKND